MPLKAGKSQGVISSNISECMASFRKDGKIGNTRPRNAAHARKMCVAMSLSKSREGGPMTKAARRHK